MVQFLQDMFEQLVQMFLLFSISVVQLLFMALSNIALVSLVQEGSLAPIQELLGLLVQRHP